MTDYTRTKATIYDHKARKATPYKSINAAKRESRKLQKAGHSVEVAK